MADEGKLRLTADALRHQVELYSKLNDSSSNLNSEDDGRSRIPLKKLMKLFEIKKKCSQERQKLFRSYVNDLCDLEMNEDIGKVLVLKEEEEDEATEVSLENLGYGDAAPEIQAAGAKENIGSMHTGSTKSNSKRESRLKFPYTDGADGVGSAIEIADCAAVRRQYNRRGSVTRYSIVAQNEVVDEYKAHEDIINQFRGDSTKIESAMRDFKHIAGDNDNDSDDLDDNVSRTSSKQSKGRGKKRQVKHKQVDGDGNAVSRFFRRGRLSMAL